MHTFTQGTCYGAHGICWVGGVADIFGITIRDPPTGWACLEALVLGKAINTEGRVVMFIRTTEGMSNVESLGMLTAATLTIGADMADSFEDEDGEDDDAG